MRESAFSSSVKPCVHTLSAVVHSPALDRAWPPLYDKSMLSKTKMNVLRVCFLLVDLGFILYWFITYCKLIPDEFLFQDYTNPLLVTWNWSFFPLDIFISATGLSSLFLFRRGDNRWRPLALISLVLTFCSGLQAIAFWAFQGFFDITWWGFNGFLLLYPLVFIPSSSTMFGTVLAFWSLFVTF